MVALATAEMEYTTPLWLAHTAIGPVMVTIVSTGEDGLTVTVKHFGRLVPQAFAAVTHTSPEVLP